MGGIAQKTLCPRGHGRHKRPLLFVAFGAPRRAAVSAFACVRRSPVFCAGDRRELHRCPDPVRRSVARELRVLFRWTWCAGKSVCLLSLRDLLASPSAFSLDVVRVDSLRPVGSELSVLCTFSCYGRRAIDVKRSSSRFRILPRLAQPCVVFVFGVFRCETD